MSRRQTAPVNVLTLTADPTVPTLRAGDLIFNSSTGKLRVFNGTIWSDVSTIETVPFFYSGMLLVSTGQSRIYTEGSYALESVRASVAIAPVGASIIVDVKKNGASIYGTPANKPTIAAGTNTALGGTASAGSFVQGDYLTVDINQTGTTTPGSDLTLVVRLRRTS